MEAKNGKLDLVKFAFGVLQIVLLGLMSWTLSEVHEMSNRITSIEANYITMQALTQFIHDNVPPPEVTLRLENLEHRIERLEDRR